MNIKLKRGGGDLWDPGLGKQPLDLTPKAQSIKEKWAHWTAAERRLWLWERTRGRAEGQTAEGEGTCMPRSGEGQHPGYGRNSQTQQGKQVHLEHGQRPGETSTKDGRAQGREHITGPVRQPCKPTRAAEGRTECAQCRGDLLSHG